MIEGDIYINCSDISSFIGQNKWDYWTPFIRLWKRVDSKGYMQCEQLSKNVPNTHRGVMDKHVELQETLGETFIKETIKTTSNKEELVKNIKESHEIIDKLDVPDQKKVELKTNVESLVNTSYGISNEYSALELYEMRYKVILDKSQPFKKIKINNVGNEQFIYICGKIDGLLKDTKTNSDIKIIEVKTRTKCFFKGIRDYENTQFQVYMYMFDVDIVDLVEYMPQNKIKIKITPVKKNKKCMDDILSKLNIFTDNFISFVQSPIDEKFKFFIMDNDDKKTFLNNL